MRTIFYYSLALTLLLSCGKENNSRVDIYLLKSFTINTNVSTNPHTLSISNAVLADTPLVADGDIESYAFSTTTFKLKKDIKSIIKDYGSDKALAITVNGKPIYFAKSHSCYLSSMTLGLATFDPECYFDNELVIGYVTIDGSSDLLELDKRNNRQIVNAFNASGRLR